MSMLWRTSRAPKAAYVARWVLALGLFGGSCSWSQAPAPSPSLEGVVVDPTGARVPHAYVHAEHDAVAETARDTTTDRAGEFALTLPPGSYDLIIEFPGFETFHTKVRIPATGAAPHLRASLAIQVHKEVIVVDPDDEVALSAADNKSSLVFKKGDLSIFSDDNTTFQQEILAMAGGTGSKDFELLIDGFSNGRFPSKQAIREIRFNRNSYSAQYAKYGLGRVEIFTQPGGEDFHGSLQVAGNDDAFNSANPYDNGEQPPYYTLNIDTSLNGPLARKTSFALTGSYGDIQNNAIVDSGTGQTAVPNPQRLLDFSGRVDRQMTSNNSFFARYDFNQSQLINNGVGLLVLPSEGTNLTTTTQTLQLSDTQVIGEKIVAEGHFQYLRTRLNQDPVSTATAIAVEGSFNGGGSPLQTQRDNQDNFEFQQYVSVETGKNFLRLGARYRLLRDANLSTAAYNGIFTFPSLQAYQQTVAGTAFAATQFNVTTGRSSAVILTGDVGAYTEDEWRARPNLTVDLGLRIESQSALPDHFDPAPRLGFSWAVGKTPRRRPFFVLRGGAGFFYDRFDPNNLLTAIRQQNGTTQPSYTVLNPQFYFTTLPTPLPSTVALSPPTLYNVDPHLHTEYGLFGGVSLDRPIGKIGTFSASYHFVRGDHQYLSRNINAPLPGTYIPGDPSSGIRPLGGTQNIYQFGSNGAAKIDSINANTHIQAGKKLSLFAFGSIALYSANDAPGSTTFPTNQYKPSADFGRPATARAQFYTGGTFQLPYGLASDSFLSLQSGAPFNITTGTDLNGDTIYNDRPSFATAASPAGSVYHTRYGTFDATPQPGETIIPVNYAAAPGVIFLETELSRNFKFGPRGPGEAPARSAAAPKKPASRPDPPYNLSFVVAANNLLNHVNPGPPVGVLGSPLFGQSISLNQAFAGTTSANRTIVLRTLFTF